LTRPKKYNRKKTSQANISFPIQEKDKKANENYLSKLKFTLAKLGNKLFEIDMEFTKPKAPSKKNSKCSKEISNSPIRSTPI